MTSTPIDFSQPLRIVSHLVYTQDTLSFLNKIAVKKFNETAIFLSLLKTPFIAPLRSFCEKGALNTADETVKRICHTFAGALASQALTPLFNQYQLGIFRCTDLVLSQKSEENRIDKNDLIGSHHLYNKFIENSGFCDETLQEQVERDLQIILSRPIGRTLIAFFLQKKQILQFEIEEENGPRDSDRSVIYYPRSQTEADLISTPLFLFLSLAIARRLKQKQSWAESLFSETQLRAAFHLPLPESEEECIPVLRRAYAIKT